MRTKNLFRTIVAATLAVVSTSAFGQYLTTTGSAAVDENAANNATEYVTIGSKMPYAVVPDPIANDASIVPAIYNPTVFRWAVTGASTPTPTKQNGAALTAAAAPDAATHVTDYQVAVSWATLGAHTITVYEQSQPTAASIALGLVGCEDATPEDISVVVLAEPTATWTETDLVLGGCSSGAGQTYAIQAEVTGFDQFQVTYSQSYQDLIGSAPVVTGATTASLGTSDFTPGGTETITAYTLAAGVNYGTYTITMTSVTDRISRKSLADTDAGAPVVQDPGGFTASVLKVYNMPTPSTGKVLKVDNATW